MDRDQIAVRSTLLQFLMGKDKDMLWMVRSNKYIYKVILPELQRKYLEDIPFIYNHSRKTISLRGSTRKIILKTPPDNLHGTEITTYYIDEAATMTDEQMEQLKKRIKK